MPALSLLLDEQISPKVAAQARARRAGLPIHSLHEWRDGFLAGREDARVLRECAVAGLTLVTYDLTTIPPLLVEWGAAGESHGGVVLVDDATIAPADIGGLVHALGRLWAALGSEDWTDAVAFLAR